MFIICKKVGFLTHKKMLFHPLRIFLFLFLSSLCLLQIKAAESGLGVHIKVDPKLKFENPKLREAYIALQSWKLAIFSDPFNFTANWNGSDVCSYNGIYCAPFPGSYNKTITCLPSLVSSVISLSSILTQTVSAVRSLSRSIA